MDYRFLLIKGNKYIERLIHSDSKDDAALYYKSRDEADGTTIILPNEYESLSTKGRQVVTIGNAASCVIRPYAEAVRITISEGVLEADGEVFVNGKRTSAVTLMPGDKILTGTTELIYHDEWLDICGVCGRTYETELISYINRPERFEEYPVYKRSPRIVKSESYSKIQIKAPDKKERRKSGELVKRILPSCVMIIATVLMSVFMGRGLYMLVMMAATAATLIITVVSYFDEKKIKEEEELEKTVAYKRYLLDKRKNLYERTEEFKEAKRYHNLSLKEIDDEVRHYSNRAFERSSIDDDFLSVSLGTSSGSPSFKIECEEDPYMRSGDALYREMIAVYNNFKVVKDIPYVVDLKSSHVGIVGRPEYCRARIMDIAARLAFFHSYHDVCMVPIIAAENRKEYEWMRWLPHTNIRDINVSGVISSENQRDQVLGHISRELKARALKRDESRKETRFVPHYVFLIDEPKLIINHSIMEHLKEEGAELGFSLVYTTQIENNLPENVRTILEVEAKDEGKVLMNEGELVNRKVKFDMSEIDFETLARRLNPIIHNKGVTTQIPESISFLELYGAESTEELGIKERWNRNKTYKSLSVPLGVRGKGDTVYLDLHEKAHGPHGLVAGTTGSGKSEILQSYILSLACNFHPHDVGFLLIDYKGGGMANLFRNLPHLLGTITNLDGAESMRALASIRSELKRRQDVFNRNGVNNINKYSEKFRAGQAAEPMPHLFIISDEFAELKKEQPEFMAELVSTARVGRSLGVHLILATQKPSGIVDDQIWSNSRFKLCLKVQNEADSRELLRTGDAANITQPGRAYLQVGNNEIYELFQSAYSGGAYSEAEDKSEVDNRIFILNELGQGKLINENLSAGDSNDVNKRTQLDAVVEAIKTVYEEVPCRAVARPWLPPLPQEIVNPSVCAKSVSALPDMSFDAGVIDMPDRQAQEVYTHDFSTAGNIVFFGTSKVGKSTAVTNAVLSLASKNTPENLNIYIVDFGNAALFGLKDLPQVADYISFDDEEKFRKLRNLLTDEISERKRMFAKADVTTLEMYNATAKEVMPAILVIVDNYDVVKEIEFDLESYFTQLTRDGQGVGIYTLITATRANAVKYAVLNNFSARICNFMSDSSEAISIIGRSDYSLSDIKGRALVSKDRVYLMQEFLPAPVTDAVTYRSRINEMIADISAGYTSRAKSIPMLPDKLEYYELMQRKGNSPGAALGLDSEDVSVRYLPDVSPFLIIGAPETGKTNILRIILEQSMSGDVFVSDARSEALKEYAGSLMNRYIASESSSEVFLDELKNLTEQRKRLYELSGHESSARDYYRGGSPFMILLDDVQRFINMYSLREDEVLEIMLNAVDVGAIIVATTAPGQLNGYDSFTKYIKEAMRGLVLGNPADQMYLMPTPQARWTEDIGYLYNNGSITKIKIPLMQ